MLLAVDTKCPYVQQLGAGRALRDYGWYLLRLLESPSGQRLLVDNPGLAGRPRPEFWVVSPIHDPAPPPAPEPPPGFVLLSSRWAEFDEALAVSGRPLSAYHRAAWAAWEDLLQCWWGPIGVHHHAVVAEQAGGYFLALPPMGPAAPRCPGWRIFRRTSPGAAGTGDMPYRSWSRNISTSGRDLSVGLRGPPPLAS